MEVKDASCLLKMEHVSDEEEDAGLEEVPDDFFDDFSNKEFLAGLDVVDAWDGTSEAKEDVCDENIEKECVSTNQMDGNVSNITIKQEIEDLNATQVIEPNKVVETKTSDVERVESKQNVDTKDFQTLVKSDLDVLQKTEINMKQEQATSVVTAEVKPSNSGSSKKIETSIESQLNDTKIKKENENKPNLAMKPIGILINRTCTNKKESVKPKSSIKAKSSGNGNKANSNTSVNSSKTIPLEESAQKKVVDNKNKCIKTKETSTVKRDSKVSQNVEEKHGTKRQRSGSKDSLKSDDRKKLYIRRDVKQKDTAKQLETRRDPKKRDRDIERDKLKCAKDKEAKMISEKLRVVETGLVPPGTEMDCDMFTTKKVEKSLVKRARSPSGYKPLMSLSPSPKRSCDRRYDRRYSPDRKLENLRKTSPLKRVRSFRQSRSISPVRKYSPRRSPFRSRYSRLSPQRRRSWSRDSTSRDRVRDSPPRKRTFLEELDEKLAQKRLQEIQQKINGRRAAAAAAAAAAVSAPLPVPAPVPAPMPVTAPIPMPVAPPMQMPIVSSMQQIPYNMQMPMYNHPASVLYDQQYFIGHPTYVQPSPEPNLYSQYNAQPNAPFQQNQYNDEVEKLFNDDKIKLTDFLCITSRANDEIPANINNKIKVIAQSQDAIKIATEYSTPSGRFIFKNSVNKLADKQEVLSNWSPLRKTPVTRLSYITKKNERPLRTPMSVLLAKLGFTSNQPVIEDVDVDVVDPPPKESVRVRMTQTEPQTCEKCEQRKQIKFVDVGIQCESSGSVDFGCQVREDDFLTTARSALQNLIKTQSLASLTPAQILASLSEKAESLKDTVPLSRKSEETIVQKPSTESDATRRDYDRRRPREHSTDRKESRRSIPVEDNRMEERWSRDNYDTRRDDRRSSSLDWRVEESWYADDPHPLLEDTRWSREDCYERRYGGDYNRQYRRETEIWDDMSRGSGSVSNRYPPPLMQRGSRFNNAHFNGPSDNIFTDDVTPGHFFNARRY